MKQNTLDKIAVSGDNEAYHVPVDFPKLGAAPCALFVLFFQTLYHGPSGCNILRSISHNLSETNGYRMLPDVRGPRNP
jgi:hypothetical protein